MHRPVRGSHAFKALAGLGRPAGQRTLPIPLHWAGGDRIGSTIYRTSCGRYTRSDSALTPMSVLVIHAGAVCAGQPIERLARQIRIDAPCGSEKQTACFLATSPLVRGPAAVQSAPTFSGIYIHTRARASRSSAASSPASKRRKCRALARSFLPTVATVRSITPSLLR
ncbi:MAG: hypothetical protein OHK0015_46920 [Chloroflexi bacterium OHK40]